MAWFHPIVKWVVLCTAFWATASPTPDTIMSVIEGPTVMMGGWDPVVNTEGFGEDEPIMVATSGGTMAFRIGTTTSARNYTKTLWDNICRYLNLRNPSTPCSYTLVNLVFADSIEPVLEGRSLWPTTMVEGICANTYVTPARQAYVQFSTTLYNASTVLAVLSSSSLTYNALLNTSQPISAVAGSADMALAQQTLPNNHFINVTDASLLPQTLVSGQAVATVISSTALPPASPFSPTLKIIRVLQTYQVACAFPKSDDISLVNEAIHGIQTGTIPTPVPATPSTTTSRPAITTSRPITTIHPTIKPATTVGPRTTPRAVVKTTAKPKSTTTTPTVFKPITVKPVVLATTTTVKPGGVKSTTTVKPRGTATTTTTGKPGVKGTVGTGVGVGVKGTTTVKPTVKATVKPITTIGPSVKAATFNPPVRTTTTTKQPGAVKTTTKMATTVKPVTGGKMPTSVQTTARPVAVTATVKPVTGGRMPTAVQTTARPIAVKITTTAKAATKTTAKATPKTTAKAAVKTTATPRATTAITTATPSLDTRDIQFQTTPAPQAVPLDVSLAQVAAAVGSGTPLASVSYQTIINDFIAVISANSTNQVARQQILGYFAPQSSVTVHTVPTPEQVFGADSSANLSQEVLGTLEQLCPGAAFAPPDVICADNSCLNTQAVFMSKGPWSFSIAMRFLFSLSDTSTTTITAATTAAPTTRPGARPMYQPKIVSLDIYGEFDAIAQVCGGASASNQNPFPLSYRICMQARPSFPALDCSIYLPSQPPTPVPNGGIALPAGQVVVLNGPPYRLNSQTKAPTPSPTSPNPSPSLSPSVSSH